MQILNKRIQNSSTHFYHLV